MSRRESGTRNHLGVRLPVASQQNSGSGSEGKGSTRCEREVGNADLVPLTGSLQHSARAALERERLCRSLGSTRTQ